jgi:hypothetical protein
MKAKHHEKEKPQIMLKFCANLEVNLIKEKQNIFFDNVLRYRQRTLV